MDPNPSEENLRFSVNNLVWGKIKGHPWRPGKIHDPKHASELAIEKHKNDHFLVAYFGDKTFAWVRESQLKHFEPYFNQMENQQSLKPFVKAVNDALLEYSKQVELGLVCKCLKKEILVELKNKKVENAGVREDTCSEGVTGSEFSPSMFLDFIQACALFPFDRIGRLELARVVGQLKAFSGYRGNNELCSLYESPVYFMDNDCITEVELSSVKPELKRSRRHKVIEGNEEDGDICGISKGKRKYVRKMMNVSHTEAIPNNGEEDIEVETSSSIKKRGRSHKIHEVDENGKESFSGEKACRSKYVHKISGNKSGRRKKVKFDNDIIEKSCKNSEELTEEEEESEKENKLKVRNKINFNSDSKSDELGRGERVKHKNEIISPLSAMRAKVGDRIKLAAVKLKASLTGQGKYEISAKDCNSPSEMLSQLYSLVIDPTNYSGIIPANIKYFTSFKDFISSMYEEGSGGRKKQEGNSGPTPFVLSETDLVQDSYWSDYLFDGSPEKEEVSKESKDKNYPGDSVMKAGDEIPTIMILGFSEPESLPSISDLIGKLSAYGPLEEEYTEIVSTKKQAKVVFKHRVDAESAYDDARIHSLFGTTLVSYKLRYSHQPSPATLPNMKTTAQINGINLES